MSKNVTPHRPPGRPRKHEPPRVSYEELDRLLVHGEVVACENGESTTIVYPTYRTLAKRYGVAHSLVAAYSAKHDCLRRREQAKARIAAQTDQKLVELRSTAIALSHDDELRIIDGFLVGFERALAEGKVRFDSPGDFNTMVRLKSFINGGADSRQEVHGMVSLEAIQDRHQRLLRAAREASPEERGEVGELPVLADAYSHEDAEDADEFKSPLADYCPDPDDDFDQDADQN